MERSSYQCGKCKCNFFYVILFISIPRGCTGWIIGVGSLLLLLLLLLLLKEVSRAMLRRSDIHPISPKTPAPQYQPIDRKKRKGKIVEDNSRARAA